VASVVIFFGAFISMENERQRRAIDGLCEQIVLWAMQDLRINRERLAREVQAPFPLDWLNNIAAKVCGYDLKMQILESFDGPKALVCISGDDANKVVFTPLSPTDLHNIRGKKSNRLVPHALNNPILSLSRDVRAHEISALNAGILFDLELPVAWKGLTGQGLESVGGLWMFEYS
jgi:hypothetical protein